MTGDSRATSSRLLEAENGNTIRSRAVLAVPEIKPAAGPRISASSRDTSAPARNAPVPGTILPREVREAISGPPWTLTTPLKKVADQPGNDFSICRIISARMLPWRNPSPCAMVSIRSSKSSAKGSPATPERAHIAANMDSWAGRERLANN